MRGHSSGEHDMPSSECIEGETNSFGGNEGEDVEGNCSERGVGLQIESQRVAARQAKRRSIDELDIIEPAPLRHRRR